MPSHYGTAARSCRRSVLETAAKKQATGRNCRCIHPKIGEPRILHSTIDANTHGLIVRTKHLGLPGRILLWISMARSKHLVKTLAGSEHERFSSNEESRQARHPSERIKIQGVFGFADDSSSLTSFQNDSRHFYALYVTRLSSHDTRVTRKRWKRCTLSSVLSFRQSEKLTMTMKFKCLWKLRAPIGAVSDYRTLLRVAI